MKTSNLEAWQVYAARCRRLDAEDAKSMPPLWKVLGWKRVAAIAMLELGSLAVLAKLLG